MIEAEQNSLTPSTRYGSEPDKYLLDRSSFTPPPAPSQYQTFSGLLKVLRQRWKLAVITGAVTLALGVGVYFLIESYAATTIIEINKDDPANNDDAQTNGPALTSDDIKNEVSTDVEILQSDDSLALAVIKQLNLLNEPSYKRAVDSDEKGTPIDQAPRTRDNAIDIFHRHLKIEAPPDTRLITITYKSTDSALAANITNALARTFIDNTLSRRQNSILTSSDWLQHQLDALKKKVQDSAQALADYERTAGLSGIQVTGTQNGNGNTAVNVTPDNPVNSRLLTLNQELNSAEANRISSEAINNLVKSNDPELVLGLGTMGVANQNGVASPSIAPESLTQIGNLRTQESALEQQLSAAIVKYGENNPRRVQLQQQVDAVKQQLQAEMGRVKERAQNSYNYAKRNEDSIRTQFQQQEGAADQLADKSVKLQMLAQEAFSNQALYQTLFSKLQTARLTSGTHATRIEIVSDAVPAGIPSFPKLSVYALGLLALALLFGVSSAFLRESMDETVRTPQDMAEIQGLAIPGYIPRLRLSDSNDVPTGGSQLITAPSSPFSEAFRALRTSISSALSRSGPRTILVTSALGSSGKTTVTYNLGVAFAQQGARVLLIDGDMRNPDLHRMFGTPLTPGLSEACFKGALSDVPGIVQHGVLPTMFMLPAGKRPDLPSEIFSSVAFETLLRKVSGLFDYVLVDSPPILAVTDASIIATKVSAVVAVVRSRNTTRLALSALAQAMHHTHAPVLSFVLNDVEHPTLDGFYEYSYNRGKEDQLANA